MTAIRNIAIAGASGDLGSPILHALISSNVFNITVLTRDSSKAQFPPSTRVIRVDYTSIPSLTAALHNQDAVISALTSSAMDTQDLLIKASIAAGVKRFIPSEFSSNIGNPKSATLPVYQSKIAVHELLKRLASENPGFTYTLIRNGPFLDWCLMKGVFVDFKGTTTPFYDGGDRRFSTTTLNTIGRAVVGVLLHLDETKNRAVFIHDLVTTQREILGMAEKLAPGRTWTPVDVSTADMEAVAQGNYAKGVVDLGASMGFLMRAVFGEGYGGEFEEVDNEMLGIPLKTDDELEGLVGAALATLEA
ncbi:hypothetical protein VE01_10054 [Pseudogymnoascus verrucosus]|uniref:NmrA-like domain-containing protein n=1 Tax=Pseudogymnoascus verrucosus TaxID=342668 RepID=A0A1B8G8L9_9PEZI|nr:uncharacterized protein VE01_10054 [Pseudogymnoascus verrucosus]OBT92174.1 hypothetical protein VE01_10054 [Pseudogymnoascus verrucosus]